jgi:hypothetical protein
VQESEGGMKWEESTGSGGTKVQRNKYKKIKNNDAWLILIL